MIPRAIPAADLAPGRISHVELVKEERPDKGQPLALQVGVKRRGVNPAPPRKNTTDYRNLKGPYAPHGTKRPKVRKLTSR